MGDKLNFKILDDNTFIVKINTSYMIFDNDNLYDQLKKILIDLRKRYYCDIYGFYDVDIYYSYNFLTILKFYKKDDDFYHNTIDLKINRHSKELKLYFYDYDILDIDKCLFEDGYLKGSIINKNDVIKLCEFYSLSDNLQ